MICLRKIFSRWLCLLLLSFCFSFLCCGKGVLAVGLNIQAEPTGVNYIRPQVLCAYSSYTFSSAVNFCSPNGPNARVFGVKLSYDRPITSGYYYELEYSVTRSLSPADGFTLPALGYVYYGPDFRVVDVDYSPVAGSYTLSGQSPEQVYTTSSQGRLVVTVLSQTNTSDFPLGYTGNAVVLDSQSASSSSSGYSLRLERISEYRPLSSQDIVGSISGQTSSLNSNISRESDDIQNATNNPDWVVQEKNDLQTEQNTGSSGASSSQTEVQNSTSSLFSVLSSVLAAVSNTNPSSCGLTLNTDYINFGTIDFCLLSPPSAISTLLSVVVVGFVVVLSYSTIKEIIDLFRSFQN